MASDLLLASASPARLALLRWAGFNPAVEVSGVDEAWPTGLAASEVTRVLAEHKAQAVAERRRDAGEGSLLVLGCDSLLEVGGLVCGKPADAAEATAWWLGRRGRSGTLSSGMCLVDLASGRQQSGVDAATINFGRPTDAEIDAYVASGEPLEVAGAFTVEGRGAPFLTGIVGHPSTVMGLSLPLLSRLLADVTGRSITDLWAERRP